ncbi:MAG: putative diguanylate cyclase [Moraxellaceae bacterium]|jgi:diguanylate cyclase (GGDEF)-like protein|nr:putative diguanylate cyclase [Moraxellaceae bacterium]
MTNEYTILRNLLKETANFTGGDFITAAVKAMAVELKTDFVFITKVIGNEQQTVEVLAAWRSGEAVAGWNFDLHGTPCDLIYQTDAGQPWTQMRIGQTVAIAKNVCQLFDATRSTNYESFIGIPLWSRKGKMIGHVALFYERDMEDDDQRRLIVELSELFCQKVQAELNRMLLEQAREQLLAELEKANERLTQESITDALTGLYNRRYFTKRLQQAFARLNRSDERYALVLVDLDHLKTLNDVHGHAAGDAALAKVAAVLLESTRHDVETVFRIGGDEFAILCSGAIDRDGLRSLGERINTAVETLCIAHGGVALPLMVSIGATLSASADQCPQDIYVRADKALYTAKRCGRNTTVVTD